MEGILSSEEHDRTARFHFEKHRRQFVFRRAVLRILLSRYLVCPPAQIEFTYSQDGKPALSEPFKGATIRFNLSCSGDLIVYAFVHSYEVGVDIERIRPIEASRIAGRFFSVRENAEFDSLPGGLENEAFFNCWTRKEAFLKAVGCGLKVPLNRFDVSLTPSRPARIVMIDGSREGSHDWELYDLRPAPGYIGALALEGKGATTTSYGRRDHVIL